MSAVAVIASVLAFVVAAQACGGESGPTPTPATSAPDGTVSVEHSNFKFVPERLSFEVGETVEFRLTSVDGPHTFTVVDLDIDWFVTGDDKRIETHTFEEPGTYRLVCKVPGHEGLGMVGEVEVR